MNKKTLIITSIALLPPFIIILITKYLPANYLVTFIYKSLYLIPIIWRVFIYKKSFKKSLSEGFVLKGIKKILPEAIIVSILLSGIYASAFFLFQDFLDFNAIGEKINGLVDVGLDNIIIVGLYIIFINSLLEEFFWRGFIFKELKIKSRLTAYLVSAFGFAIYHVAFFYNWFPFFIILLAIFGLFMYAIIMNLLFEKHKTLFSCYFAHFAVDTVQISIGLKIFGLL